jgi:eukaryotic-like serine/threonine-protein kinase
VNSAARSGAGRDEEYLAALALAYAKDDKKLASLTDDLGKRFPEATLVQFNYLPTLRAKLSVSRGDARETIDGLRAVAPFELGKTSASNSWVGLYPIYVRGEAYLAARQASEAAAEFQKFSTIAGLCLTRPSER